MTLEERMAALEAELAQLRGNQPARTITPYKIADKNCREYFEQVKAHWQKYGGLYACQQVARDAFKEKHGVKEKGASPMRYIETEDDGTEYFELFKAFLSVYQAYVHKGNKEATREN